MKFGWSSITHMIKYKPYICTGEYSDMSGYLDANKKNWDVQKRTRTNKPILRIKLIVITLQVQLKFSRAFQRPVSNISNITRVHLAFQFENKEFRI